MYLVDTNVWLERLLGQARSEEVGDFLSRTPSEHLFMTDFALHSLGVVLSRLNRGEVLLCFIQDVFIEGAVSIISLEPKDMEAVVSVMQRFKLDFDDAYHYVAAEQRGLTIVSFDADFDRTEKGRKTPEEVSPVVSSQ